MHALAEEGAGQKVSQRKEGLTRDGKFLSCEKEKGREKKEEREGRGFPLRREKEESDGISFHHHYFSISQGEERHKKKIHEQE